MSRRSLRTSERWNATLVTSAPSISISTVTANLSSPGRSEQAWFDSTSGSIGSTARGTYTLVPRRKASRSSRPPGRT